MRGIRVTSVGERPQPVLDFSPGTRKNSRSLSVTTAKSSAIACDAISKSFGSMGLPVRSSDARNSP